MLEQIAEGRTDLVFDYLAAGHYIPSPGRETISPYSAPFLLRPRHVLQAVAISQTHSNPVCGVSRVGECRYGANHRAGDFQLYRLQRC